MASPDIRKVSILGKESIHCGFHLIPYIVETVLQTLPSSTYVLITDTNVADLHLPAFQSEFGLGTQNVNAHSKPRLLSFIVPPGEASKSREGKAEIEDFLLLNKCTRDTVILAIGGGVIGDLVGFVAATFMRGVRFVQIPTTLLAMVDSSVGGKTAIDTPHGKNLIGAFWQPEYIFIDAAFLETLPSREFSNGMAEVVKTAAIWKEDDFASLESRSSEIFTAIQTPSSSHSGRTLDTRSVAQQLLLSVIIGSISVKAHIVTIDERETGLRNLVNFGHTIGHAIEAVLTPTILHGECVSIGMVLEAGVARAMGVLSQDAIERLARCLRGFNLPVSLSDSRISHLPAAKSLSTERLLDIMKVDKKNSGPQKKIVILSKVGATYEQKATDVADSIIADILSGPIRTLFESIESSDKPRVASPESHATKHSSVVLIGMRGSGKTFIGKLAALVLDWAFLDADTLFEVKHQINVREFVHQRGWPAFREAETGLLKELLDTYPTGHVISLGGGIVETPSARAILKAYARNGPVVYITRKLHEILAYLGDETARPAYDEPVSDVFHRREPWFVELSNYEYINPTQTRGGTKEGKASFPSLSLEAITRDVTRFFGHITGESPNLSENLLEDNRSYFLCLTYPDLTPALRDIEALTIGSDAIELRVDLLHSPQDKVEPGPYIPPIKYVFDQLAALRQWTNLPIVFTTRSVAEGGKFPNSASKEAFELFNMALRHGVEYIDVEMAWPGDLIQALVARKGYSQIVASYHDWSGNLKWNSRVVEEKYRIGASFADIVKIVGKANTIEDNFALHTFVSRKRDNGAKPIIAINMGFEGKISRVLNRTFSPVTHPLLPNKAAPGQLSFTEIQTTLHAIGQLPALRFFHLGDEPNVHSLLPTLQNTAFRALGLPHSSESCKTNNLEEIRTLLASPDFGGASIVPGRKVGDLENISISKEARAIGIIDTIVARRNEDGSCILFGDNTEWLAIRTCITSALPFSTEIPNSALVLGVGETSRAVIYALQRFGMKSIYLFDETRNTSQDFADSITTVQINVLDTLGSWPDGGGPPSVVVSTRSPSLGNFHLPAYILAHPLGGVVVDTANTSDTPLLRLADEVGSGWQTVTGVNVVLEQGFSQLHTWTGRRYPKPPVLIAVQNQTTVVST